MKTGKITVIITAIAVAGIIATLALINSASQTQAGTAELIKEISEKKPSGMKSITVTPNPNIKEEITKGIDLDHIMGERGYGDPKAPVRIDEYASLSCSHCAMFHKNILPKLKEKFIDTGKVYFVFHDFPLNAQALAASVVSRCMPEDRYHSFLSFLFDKQDKWAYEANFLNILKQNAKLAGGNGDDIEACLENEDIRTALVTKMQDASKKHQINSTPSFVINGSQKFSGSLSMKELSKQINAALKEAR